MKRRGILFVLSSPSGAGKTSLARALLAEDGRLQESVSYTTRPMRGCEQDGVDYHFVDVPRFNGLVAEGALMEWAQVFGNLYGTPRDPVINALSQGRDVIFDIDWQGAQQLSQHVASDLATIFVLPPDWPSLEKRLRKRQQDSDENIQYRMSRAQNEIAHWAEYDYVVINDNFYDTLKEIKSIITAERLLRRRQTGLGDFINGLVGSHTEAEN